MVHDGGLDEIHGVEQFYSTIGLIRVVHLVIYISISRTDVNYVLA